MTVPADKRLAARFAELGCVAPDLDTLYWPFGFAVVAVDSL